MDGTTIYRGPSGTTIDWTALEAELEANDYVLVLDRDADMSLSRDQPVQRTIGSFDVSCRAELSKFPPNGPVVAVDDEDFLEGERVEGLARLLRRVLPEPAKVLAHMSDEQWYEPFFITYCPAADFVEPK